MKILFVCLGNICRSPIADGILNHLIKNNPLLKNIEVDSAGTESYHVGHPADRRALNVSLQRGIDLHYHRARQISRKDFEYYDRIYTMAVNVHHEVLSMAKSEADKKKVVLFMDIISPGQNLSVHDPYYGSESSFIPVFEQVEIVCNKLLEDITGK